MPGADAMVVVGYGQIIPQSVIDLVPNGIINVHASLLPKYRGAGPIQWAIVHGETRTGVTTMRIDAGLDTGDMLLKAETEIGPDENAIELGQRLAVMGADGSSAPNMLAPPASFAVNGPSAPSFRISSSRSGTAVLGNFARLPRSRDMLSLGNRMCASPPTPEPRS